MEIEIVFFHSISNAHVKIKKNIENKQESFWKNI